MFCTFLGVLKCPVCFITVNTQLRILYLLYDIDFTGAKTTYVPIKHRFLTNQSARRVLSIL